MLMTWDVQHIQRPTVCSWMNLLHLVDFILAFSICWGVCLVDLKICILIFDGTTTLFSLLLFHLSWKSTPFLLTLDPSRGLDIAGPIQHNCGKWCSFCCRSWLKHISRDVLLDPSFLLSNSLLPLSVLAYLLRVSCKMNCLLNWQPRLFINQMRCCQCHSRRSVRSWHSLTTIKKRKIAIFDCSWLLLASVGHCH